MKYDYHWKRRWRKLELRAWDSKTGRGKQDLPRQAVALWLVSRGYHRELAILEYSPGKAWRIHLKPTHALLISIRKNMT